MKVWIYLAMMVLVAATANAQITAVSRQKLPLDRIQKWSAPRFAPDGKTIFYTSETNDGIWAYSLASKKAIQITADQGAGYGFTVSANGNQIAYRRTTTSPGLHERVQEILVADRSTTLVRTLGTGANMSTPVFAGEKVLFTRGTDTQEAVADLPPDIVQVLGIENTKILLLRNGRREIFDPLGDGSYVWPCLSPDGKLLVAYDMSRGTFVWTLEGEVRAKLGRRNAPVWTRDGRWIVYMDDRDDGHQVKSSDLYCVSADGKRTGRLTNTRAAIEMYPACSPLENKIVYSTLAGEIYLLEYREGGR